MQHHWSEIGIAAKDSALELSGAAVMEPNARQQFDEEEMALAGSRDEPYPGDPVDFRAVIQEVKDHKVDWCWHEEEENLMDKGGRDLLAAYASATDIAEWATAWHRKLGGVPGLPVEVITRLTSLAFTATSTDRSAQAELRLLLEDVGAGSHW